MINLCTFLVITVIKVHLLYIEFISSKFQSNVPSSDYFELHFNSYILQNEEF